MIDVSEEKMNYLLAGANLTRCSGPEVAFIRDFCGMMKPVAQALDILQGDKNMYMGFLLPTLVRLKEKLSQKVVVSTYCKTLGEKLCFGIDKRFGHLFNEKQVVLAAVTSPKLHG